MAENGITRKLAVVAVALGALLLVLRVVGGRGDEGPNEGAIDRVDTGRSDEDRIENEGSPVDTGLERVSTADADEAADVTGGPDTVGTGDAPEPAGSDDTDDTEGTDGNDEPTDDLAVGADLDTAGTGADEDEQSESVPVVPTGGRFDDLDVFDIISIVSAGVDAAREEYRSRT